MKISRFNTLWDVDVDNEDDIFRLREGQFFLHGNSMINQKSLKEVGDEVVYFKVIRKEGKSVEFMQIFDVLEEG